ncbi:branched-chain amino acid transporter permease [Facklamia lactis]|uniref:branched-chain amino acid transporter permease n=1 Tax=Facklamia lactis TaxID=2749967 RepID=UPI0018CED4A5|nr:AzlD domain-containing protein [Facklamia lactis]MBG9981187.1 AzlD domain-containing protein [Facklamia lactis]
MSNIHSLLLLLVMGAVTALIRFFPFIVFKNQTPLWVIYLGQVFPYSIMAILFIYSIKDIEFMSSQGLAALLACGAIFLVHKWRHSTILSILVGTAVYMILIQGVLA